MTTARKLSSYFHLFCININFTDKNHSILSQNIYDNFPQTWWWHHIYSINPMKLRPYACCWKAISFNISQIISSRLLFSAQEWEQQSIAFRMWVNVAGRGEGMYQTWKKNKKWWLGQSSSNDKPKQKPTYQRQNQSHKIIDAPRNRGNTGPLIWYRASMRTIKTMEHKI